MKNSFVQSSAYNYNSPLNFKMKMKKQIYTRKKCKNLTKKCLETKRYPSF